MAQLITILVNGKSVSLKQGTTLNAVLDDYCSISLETKGVAVAYNEEVIARSRWHEITVTPESSIEIVHAVQGG